MTKRRHPRDIDPAAQIQLKWHRLGPHVRATVKTDMHFTGLFLAPQLNRDRAIDNPRFKRLYRIFDRPPDQTRPFNRRIRARSFPDTVVQHRPRHIRIDFGVDLTGHIGRVHQQRQIAQNYLAQPPDIDDARIPSFLDVSRIHVCQPVEQ